MWRKVILTGVMSATSWARIIVWRQRTVFGAVNISTAEHRTLISLKIAVAGSEHDFIAMFWSPGHLAWVNDSNHDRVVNFTHVPGGALASLAVRGRQQKQDETRPVFELDLFTTALLSESRTVVNRDRDAEMHSLSCSHGGRAHGCIYAGGPALGRPSAEH